MAKRRQKADRGQTARLRPIEQLDSAVEALMADAKLPRINADVAALLRIAGDLRAMPRQDFKKRLKADLNRSIKEKKQAKAAPTVQRRHGVATPYLMIRDASRAIDFYKRAFGATELSRMADPHGHIAHAEIKIGDAPIMIADEAPEYFNVSPASLGGSSAFVHVYVDDIDAFARRAERGGAKVLEPPQDYPYGDRRGKFVDPFGHVWMVATHKQDVTAEQMKADWDRSVAAEKAKQVPKPEGYHSITPYLKVYGAGQLIDFLKSAFDAEEVVRVQQPDGTIRHAQMKVAGSMIELADASDQFKPNPTAIWLFVADADASYRQALAAGATSLNKPADQDYGNREAGVRDPFGNHWYIATPLPTANPRPTELRTVTPYLHPKGTAKLMDFLKTAFGAEEVMRVADDAGVVHHGQMKIGDSIIAMGEAHGQYPPMPPALHLYVRDTDAAYQSALRAGAKSIYAPRDESYGDRAGGVTDPFGNDWYIATHQHPEQLATSVSESQATTRSKDASSSAVKAEVHLQVRNAAKLIDFIKTAFNADEIVRHKTPDGSIAHAELGFDGSIVTTGDLSGDQKPMPTAIHLYVPDTDAAYKRALDAGSVSIHEPTDMEYGERGASVTDPFGNNWYLATSFKARETGAPRSAYVPAGTPRAIPALHPKGTPAMIDFLKNAFGAEETLRAETPDGTIAHAKLRIGQSVIELGEAHGPYQPRPSAFHIYVDDTDAAYRKALAAGAVSIEAPADQPYGYRNAAVRDPAGNEWRINAPIHAAENAPQPSEPTSAIMPFMYFEDAGAAADYYKQVFKANELHRNVEEPGGRPSHVQISIGNTRLMLRDATTPDLAEYIEKGYARTPRQLGGTPLHLYVYVPDADAAFKRAVDSGSVVVDPMGDKEWGDRCGGVKDPFGHIWYVATPLKDVRR